MNTTQDVIHALVEWDQLGSRVTLVTVCRTWGSAPRQLGSMMVVREDGQFLGSVSGGCVEEDLLEKICQNSSRRMAPEIRRYGDDRKQADRFGFPCGGILEVLIEPIENVGPYITLKHALHNRQLCRKSVDLNSHAVTIDLIDKEVSFSFDGTHLVQTIGPVWKLLLIGAGELSQQLARMALMLDYQIIVCDPREQYQRNWPIHEVQFCAGMPDDVVKESVIDSRVAVIALTHDAKLDDMALMQALDSPAFYVGALGSRQTTIKRRERLLALGIASESIDRLWGPVGLAIGSRTPAEISISVLAHLTQVRSTQKLIKSQ